MMTDNEMIDWLDADSNRLQVAYWYLENNDGTVRDAIHILARDQNELA